MGDGGWLSHRTAIGVVDNEATKAWRSHRAAVWVVELEGGRMTLGVM